MFAIDIDNTITDPAWFDSDFQATVEQYIQARIITRADVEGLRFHPQLYLLPQVALTHRPKAQAVETLQQVAATGSPIFYCTARNHINPDVCRQIHANTYTWLEQHGFPFSRQVQFFWNVGDKLIHALETSEPQSFLVDDRPQGLIEAYHQIAVSDPALALQIRERVTLIAFGYTDVQQFSRSDVRVIPLEHWSRFGELHLTLG